VKSDQLDTSGNT